MNLRVIIKCPKGYCRGAYNNVTGVLMEKNRTWSQIRVDEAFYEDIDRRGFINYPRIPNEYVFPFSQKLILKNE